MNLWAFAPSVLGELERAYARFLRSFAAEDDVEFLLPNFVGELLRSGEARIRVLRGAGSATGLTRQSDRAYMTELLRGLVDRGDYPSPVWL
jgi:hypothetical protein